MDFLLLPGLLLLFDKDRGGQDQVQSNANDTPSNMRKDEQSFNAERVTS